MMKFLGRLDVRRKNFEFKFLFQTKSWKFKIETKSNRIQIDRTELEQMRMINEKTNPSLLLNLDGKPSLISTSCLQEQVQGHIWI